MSDATPTPPPTPDEPNPAPHPAAQPGPLFGGDIHHMVAQLRLVGALVSLALGGVILVGLVILVVRIFSPTDGTFGPVATAGVVAVLALAGGLVTIELTSRKAKKAVDLEAAATFYKIGCVVAGGANFVGGVVTLCVLQANGVSKSLWIPTLIVLALNLLGLILAVPRVKHLRALHYRPILPVTRV